MQKYILGFYVSVDDIAVVHELDGVADLSGHCANLFLLESAILAERGVDVAAAAGFQHEVEMLFVVEEAIKLDYVGVVKVALDFHFSDELVDEAGLAFEYFFRDFLERADPTSKHNT